MRVCTLRSVGNTCPNYSTTTSMFRGEYFSDTTTDWKDDIAQVVESSVKIIFQTFAFVDRHQLGVKHHSKLTEPCERVGLLHSPGDTVVSQTTHHVHAAGRGRRNHRTRPRNEPRSARAESPEVCLGTGPCDRGHLVLEGLAHSVSSATHPLVEEHRVRA